MFNYSTLGAGWLLDDKSNVQNVQQLGMNGDDPPSKHDVDPAVILHETDVICACQADNDDVLLSTLEGVNVEHSVLVGIRIWRPQLSFDFCTLSIIA